MIKVYSCGNDFYNENKDFLLTNGYSEVFFRLDSPLLITTNKKEFAIKVYDESHTLLVLAKEPFNNLYYGDKELCNELVNYLISNHYEIKDFISEESLGYVLSSEFLKAGITFNMDIALDYMIATKKVKSLPNKVDIPTLEDVNQIYELEKEFLLECGLKDVPNLEKITNKISNFRVIREGHKIISFVKISEGSKTSFHISEVYTMPSYRNRHLSKALCSYALNEIIDKGYIATLNVDRANNISNHLYSSIGFTKIFSQAIFVRK